MAAAARPTPTTPPPPPPAPRGRPRPGLQQRQRRARHHTRQQGRQPPGGARCGRGAIGDAGTHGGHGSMLKRREKAGKPPAGAIRRTGLCNTPTLDFMQRRTPMSVYEQLKELRISLPPVSVTSAAYVPYVQTSPFIFLSRHIPRN